MNRSNAGANTNILQIVLDVIIMAFAYLIDVVCFGSSLETETLLEYTILCGVFTLIFILSNKEEYLYNITLFYYMDRIHKKLTKSFLIAMIATAAVMNYVVSFEKGRKFFFLYLIISYALICIKMFFYKPLMRYVQRDNVPRTVFVGKVGAFNKFRYFMEKTSIQVDFVGYIATSRQELEEDHEKKYIGCLEDLENLIRTHNIDQLYLIQKNSEELPFTQKYVDLCIEMGVTVRLIVDFYKRRRANSYVSTVGTYPVITYHTITLNSYEQMVKRAVDLVG